MFARFQVQFACFTSLIKAFGKKMIRNPWNNRDDTVRDVRSATLKRMVLADVHIQLRWRWRKISEAHGKLYSPHSPANRSTPHETSWNCRQDPIQPPSMPSLKQLATLPRTFWWSPTPPALPSSLRVRKLQGNRSLVENRSSLSFRLRRFMKSKPEAARASLFQQEIVASSSTRAGSRSRSLGCLGSLLVALPAISWPVVYFVQVPETTINKG